MNAPSDPLLVGSSRDTREVHAAAEGLRSPVSPGHAWG